MKGNINMMPSYNEKSSFQVPEQQFGYFVNGNKLLSSIADNPLISIVIWTLDGTVVCCNKNTQLMAGLSDTSLTGAANIDSIISKDVVQYIKGALINGIKDKKQRHIYNSSLVPNNGNNTYVKWNHYMTSDDAGIVYIVSTGIDITSFKNTEKQLEEANRSLAAANEELAAQHEALMKSEERYKLVMDSSYNGLWDWDLINDKVYISENWCNMLGLENQEICSYRDKLKEIIHPEDFSKFTQNLNKQLEKENHFYQSEYRIRLKSGKYIWICSKGKILWDQHKIPVRIIGSHEDISQQKKLESKLKHLAYYDSLTNVPSRATFMEKLNDSIADARRNSSQLAVLFLDLDNFKVINDTYGHHIGDKLLKNIALKLKSCISTSATLSRIGGDEFAILVTDFTRIKHLDEIAVRIMEIINKPLDIDGNKLYTSVSIGIAVYPDCGLNGIILLKNADIAMYRAKGNGKNSYQYFDNYTTEKTSLECDIKKDLTKAIEKGELFLCYQPLVDTMTKRIVAMEALIRWRHPHKGIISPLQFIPIAEETELMIPIGLWVLRTACSQLREWRKIGYTDLSLAVNVSTIQLQQTDFGEAVINILSETGLSPEYLELEITESVLLESVFAAKRNLKYLKKQGVRISIDDFGTGYNSLKYIQELDINSIKIDRTFISDIEVNINKTIIDAIITLGHDINVEVTAEGVETKEQYDYLKKGGCDKIQGYYFSKPLLPKEVVKFLIHSTS